MCHNNYTYNFIIFEFKQSYCITQLFHVLNVYLSGLIQHFLLLKIILTIFFLRNVKCIYDIYVLKALV